MLDLHRNYLKNAILPDSIQWILSHLNLHVHLRASRDDFIEQSTRSIYIDNKVSTFHN